MHIELAASWYEAVAVSGRRRGAAKRVLGQVEPGSYSWIVDMKIITRSACRLRTVVDNTSSVWNMQADIIAAIGDDQ